METNGTYGHVSNGVPPYGAANDYPPTSRDLDHAWALFHIGLVADGLVGRQHLAEQMQRYDALAAAYPQLAYEARDAIERLLAQQRKERPHGA